MTAVFYADQDLSLPLTPAWRAWLLRAEFMFRLHREPPSVKYAVIKWRDGTQEILSRRRANAFCYGIAIESESPDDERNHASKQGAFGHIKEGVLWLRDLNAGRSPVARYIK
jgi:hypothetical protein